MSEKKPVKEGDRVLLVGPPDSKVLAIPFEVVKVLDRESLRVRDPRGVNLRVHKSRVSRILEPDEKSITIKSPLIDVKAAEQKSANTLDESRKRRKESTMSEKEKAKPKPKEKAQKKEVEIVPFEPKAWAESKNAHVVLQKQCTFDHANHKLYSYVAISKSFVWCVNAYRYPNNKLGGAQGETKYPLKGQRITQKVKDGAETRILKGTKTPEKVLEERKKKGFKVLFELSAKAEATPDEPAEAKTEAPVAEVVATPTA